MEIFRDDAGVPRAARGRNHSGDEIGKNSGEDQVAPAIETAESKDVGDFFQIRGNGHSAGDDVEQNVPLGAEEHERHGGNFHAAAQVNQEKKNDGEQRGRGNGSGKLHQRLSDTSETRVEADGDAHGDGPESADQ